jgi:hypothetical protein
MENETPKEYEITEFTVGTLKDNYGNTWCTAIFENEHSEPVKIVVKDPSKYSVGMKLWGHIKFMTAKSGAKYFRFYRAERPEQEPAKQNQTTDKPTPEYWSNKDQTIRACWAIGKSVDINGNDAEKVEEYALQLFKMVDSVIKQANTPSLKEKFAEVKAEKAQVKTVDEVVTEIPDNIDDKFMEDIPY